MAIISRLPVTLSPASKQILSRPTAASSVIAKPAVTKPSVSTPVSVKPTVPPPVSVKPATTLPVVSKPLGLTSTIGSAANSVKQTATNAPSTLSKAAVSVSNQVQNTATKTVTNVNIPVKEVDKSIKSTANVTDKSVIITGAALAANVKTFSSILIPDLKSTATTTRTLAINTAITVSAPVKSTASTVVTNSKSTSVDTGKNIPNGVKSIEPSGPKATNPAVISNMLVISGDLNAKTKDYIEKSKMSSVTKVDENAQTNSTKKSETWVDKALVTMSEIGEGFMKGVNTTIQVINTPGNVLRSVSSDLGKGDLNNVLPNAVDSFTGKREVSVLDLVITKDSQQKLNEKNPALFTLLDLTASTFDPAVLVSFAKTTSMTDDLINQSMKTYKSANVKVSDVVEDGAASKWVDDAGKNIWPPNNGAIAGTEKMINLNKGTTFGRIGGDTGSFVAPPKTSPDKLSLAPRTDITKYTEYLVTKPISGVEKATVAPWFDKLGGGTQFKLPMTIRELIREGYIAPK